MASNLLKKLAPQKYVVMDVFESSTARFVKEHAGAANVVVAKTPLEVAQHCDIIVTMLPASQHVRSVYLGKDGLLAGIKAGSLLIDSSTIDPGTSQSVANAFKAKSAIVVDAPVSGGTLGAQAGTLTFMVGAQDDAAFDKVKPYLEGMGKNIVSCGGNGNGQVAKICNNMMLGISMIAASETMNLGTRLGMDPKLLASIINTSTGRCWSMDTYNPCPGVIPTAPASRDYEGGFGVSLMAKDMGLAIAAANDVKSTVVLGGVAHQLYNQVSSTSGYEKKDFSSVFRWLNDNAKRY
eukprot:jgi/Hompol1/708/HPOL_004366-RA